MSPHISRNTDGMDPGETNVATCGVMAYNTISTGDDHIALKGGHWVSGVLIAHNHFGTGHGMSIGSETYGGVTRRERSAISRSTPTRGRWATAPARVTSTGFA